MLDGPWSYALLKTAPEAVRPSLKMMAVPFRPHMGGAANSLHIPAGIFADRKKNFMWQFITAGHGAARMAARHCSC